jgi:hypothetical protein
MAAVISDGASQGDALPDSHVEQISREMQALIPHLPTTFNAEVVRMLEDLKPKPAAGPPGR